MIPMTIKEIATIVGGSIHNLDENSITSATPILNSKSAVDGNFFVALPGERVNGHDFATEAIALGCEFALVTKEMDIPSILVKDCVLALAALARESRNLFTDCVVIGVTGSQGKTTTKDLLKHILSIAGETIVGIGSQNNELGVPLTILNCTPKTKYCVVEMGARHLGDIDYLAKIVKPTIGVVLVVGTAHIGEFGSRREIAQTKSELIRALPIGGTAILGSYDELTPLMADGLDLKVLSFGEKNDCNVRAADIEVREGYPHFDLVTPTGRAAVSLRLLGLHQISNALAAAAVAHEVGMNIESIAAALSTAESASKWRMELRDLAGMLIINDSYNSNPESAAAALRTLALMTQERGGVSWAFLGKMHELGESEAKDHLEIGRLASDLGIDHLVCIGTLLYLSGLELDVGAGDEMEIHYFLTKEEGEELFKHFSSGDVILLKASRAEHFDQLAEAFVALAQDADDKGVEA